MPNNIHHPIEHICLNLDRSSNPLHQSSLRMPPHLHPRSSATTTLFASTLAASFIIVGIPHIFPCPAPRKGYLDADGKTVRRRPRRSQSGEGEVGDKVEGHDGGIGTADAQLGLGRELKTLLASTTLTSDSSLAKRDSAKGDRGGGREEEDARALFREMEEEEEAMERERRECPVPKPRGKIGELLGFGTDRTRQRREERR
jgi:cytochrome c oxidase assembly factor 2